MKYFVDHWKRFLFFALFILFLRLFFLFFVEVLPIEDNVQVIKIFGITLSNWGTLLAISGTIFTLIWAMFQYDKQLSRIQQEKAYEVSKIFSDELLIPISIIGQTLTTYPQLTKIYNSIDNKKLKRFDIYEIGLISNNKDIVNTFEEIFISQELNAYFHEVIDTDFPDVKINKKTVFSDYVTTAMNKLEAISINISSYSSGIDYLYPSLHQVFIPFVEAICINISRLNKNYTTKYYINLIEVYNAWKRIREKELNKELKEFKKYQNKVNKYTLKLEKIKNKNLEKKPRKI